MTTRMGLIVPEEISERYSLCFPEGVLQGSNHRDVLGRNRLETKGLLLIQYPRRKMSQK